MITLFIIVGALYIGIAVLKGILDVAVEIEKTRSNITMRKNIDSVLSGKVTLQELIEKDNK